MALSKHSIIMIQTREVICEGNGPDADGKFEGCIKYGKSLLTGTGPIYNSKLEAEQSMWEIVHKLRSMKSLAGCRHCGGKRKRTS